MKTSYLKNTIFFLIPLFLIFFSCSQNLPEVGPATSSIIFEYDNSESLPNARFSVFVEAISDYHRFVTLKVISEEKGYEWETDNISNIIEDNRVMSGYTHFVMPEGEKIPTGKYTAVYTNADKEQTEVVFFIDYIDNIYEIKAKDVPAFMKKHYGTNKLAVYDNSNILLYFGDRNYDYETPRDIWNNLPGSNYINDIWTIPQKSMVCVLPKEDIKLEKSDVNNSDDE